MKSRVYHWLIDRSSLQIPSKRFIDVTEGQVLRVDEPANSISWINTEATWWFLLHHRWFSKKMDTVGPMVATVAAAVPDVDGGQMQRAAQAAHAVGVRVRVFIDPLTLFLSSYNVGYCSSLLAHFWEAIHGNHPFELFHIHLYGHLVTVCATVPWARRRRRRASHLGAHPPHFLFLRLGRQKPNAMSLSLLGSPFPLSMSHNWEANLCNWKGDTKPSVAVKDKHR